MLREYEFTVITNPYMQEEEAKQLVEKYETMLLAGGGEVIRKNDWGAKKLAFPIKKQYRGRYLHYDFIGKPENLAQVERLMRIDDNVLRYLSVRVGENVNVDERKAQLAKQDAQIAAQKESANALKERA